MACFFNVITAFEACPRAAGNQCTRAFSEAMHPTTTLVLLPLACRVLLISATKYQPVQPFELQLQFFLPRPQSLEHAKLATTVPEALARPMPMKATPYSLLKPASFSDFCNQTSGCLLSDSTCSYCAETIKA